ncbi:hypothetical protein PENTCL1PPCAC_24672, partial [Pristionchus entomophagus]
FTTIHVSNLSALRKHRIFYTVTNLSRSTGLSGIDHFVLEGLQKLVTLMGHASGVEDKGGLLPVVVLDALPVPGGGVLASVQPDLHLLERVVDGVAEDDEPGAREDEQRVDLVGVTQTADEESHGGVSELLGRGVSLVARPVSVILEVAGGVGEGDLLGGRGRHGGGVAGAQDDDALHDAARRHPRSDQAERHPE